MAQQPSPGARQDPSALEHGRTETLPGSGVPRSPLVRGLAPGTVLAGRYRIVASLGRGGMGEVFRADDLRLGEPVALKFLAPELAADRTALERVYAEVRLGRRVSHPNVCRIHDLVEAEDGVFLTMEYVDGEDLASLLRRIGRLPKDKCVELARQLCAGLAAVHEQGVVHCDLKPANVLVDGRGMARLTDFGVATAERDLTASGPLAGTLAYMAPEQLARNETSVRSDLYSLGLVLYEMTAGRRPFAAASVSELIAQQLAGEPPRPSEVTGDVDPRLEAVVLRCLARDPEARPASAQEVLAALPGGDPLAAAVAAGETPSPEMVAAAGARGELQPVAAWTLAVVALAGLVATALLNDRTQLYRQVGPLEPPEVLVHRAEDVLGLVQERRPARDHAYHFALDEVAQMRARLSAAEVLRARPGPLRFFYRRTPRGLVPHGGHFSRLWLAGYSDLGRVGREDPPLRDAGEAEVVLSPRGDLIELRRVPTPAPAGQPRWEPLLAATGIEATSLREVPPRERPAVPADTRRAWVARFPGESSAVRLEGASWAGQPVWLRVMGAWTEGAPAPEGEVPRQLARWVAVIGSLTLVVGVALAVRNLRRGRGDRRGAMRLALFCFLLTTAAQLLRVHHSSDPEQELYLLMSLVGQALFCAAAAWLFYVVLEPFCRRRWPRLLIAWSRLLAGRWRDPMVGRDALIGASAAALLGGAASLIWSRGRDVLSPSVPLSALSQASDAFYYFLHVAFVATINSVAILYLLVLARALLRRQAVAMAVVGGLLTLPFFAYSGGGSVAALFAVLAGGVTLLVLTRYGLLAHAVFAWVWISGGMVPLTLDPQAFYFGRSALVLAVLAVLTLLAFRSSLGGRSPWRLELLEA